MQDGLGCRRFGTSTFIFLPTTIRILYLGMKTQIPNIVAGPMSSSKKFQGNSSSYPTLIFRGFSLFRSPMQVSRNCLTQGHHCFPSHPTEIKSQCNNSDEGECRLGHTPSLLSSNYDQLLSLTPICTSYDTDLRDYFYFQESKDFFPVTRLQCCCWKGSMMQDFLNAPSACKLFVTRLPDASLMLETTDVANIQSQCCGKKIKHAHA